MLHGKLQDIRVSSLSSYYTVTSAITIYDDDDDDDDTRIHLC
jgi:hypothetical protein